MSKYVVESPHTPEECTKALDELAEKGEDTLKQFAFGCKSGEHTGWAYVDADNKKEALEMALYHFPVIFKIRLTPIDANLRQQMRKSVKSASKIITGITGFWNSAISYRIL